MARAGVSYFDVAKAAEAVKANQLPPTVDRVREKLGTGSRSTIAPLLKRWRSEGDSAAESVAGLPSDLLQLVQSINERIHTAAELKIEAAVKASKEVELALKTTLQETLRKLETTQNERAALVNQSAESNKKLKDIEKALIDTQTSASKYQGQYEAAQSQLNEMKATIRELRTENKDIREHFEHYQQRTAEDRLLERNQFKETNQLLSEQNAQLKQRVENLSVEKQGLEHELAQVKSSLLSEQRNNINTQQDAQKCQTMLDHISRELDCLTAEKRQLQHIIDENKKELSSLESDNRVVKKENVLKDQTVVDLEKRLEKQSQKAERLNDALQVALQEKSVLQGQLQQLQSSLN